jgi:hypothetical protein
MRNKERRDIAEETLVLGDREDSRITFVTRVEKIGDGPAWRR